MADDRTRIDLTTAMVSAVPSESQRLVARFVEVEEGTPAMTHAEIDAANGAGFWFVVQEFRLEAG